jgi:hypothetical protein
MMWSIAVVPAMQDHDGFAIIQDTAGQTVQARSLTNASKVGWKLNNVAFCDCLTSLPDKNHLYITDYDIAPRSANDWLGAINRADTIYKDSVKFLLVVDASTGQIELNYTIPHIRGVNPTLLVPGANDDVFMGSRNGVIRIFKKPLH